MWTFSWCVLINLWTVVRLLFFLSVSDFRVFCFLLILLYSLPICYRVVIVFWFNKEQEEKFQGAIQTWFIVYAHKRELFEMLWAVIRCKYKCGLMSLRRHFGSCEKVSGKTAQLSILNCLLELKVIAIWYDLRDSWENKKIWGLLFDYESVCASMRVTFFSDLFCSRVTNWFIYNRILCLQVVRWQPHCLLFSKLLVSRREKKLLLCWAKKHQRRKIVYSRSI